MEETASTNQILLNNAAIHYQSLKQWATENKSIFVFE